MKISIIGTGYVGLVTGVCFAEMGNDVCCVDVDQNKIDQLNRLEIPIYEPGLENMMLSNYTEKRLSFTTDIKAAISKSDIVFIAVGTPPGEDGSADLTQVLNVASEIGRYMMHHMYVIDKSTVPVGTAEKVAAEIKKQINIRISESKNDLNENLTFDVISNPEFLKEGSAIGDCMRPDRVVIGTDNEKALKIVRELYMPFIRNTENFITMDIKSAEMTKYVANSMLATKISFMNEMANICESVGADINKVRLGIGSDQRIGYHFIYAGCGYGGSCFPKDVKALIQTGLANGYEPQILQSVEAVNNKQKYKLVEMIIGRFGEALDGITFGIWGLSFKPDTDDMREAPAITIINELIKRGARIKAYDPKATNEAKEIYLKDLKNISYFDSKYDAIKDVDAMIMITEWKEFRSPDFYEMKKLMNKTIIFDGRNQYDKEAINEIGFEYHQIGVRI